MPTLISQTDINHIKIEADSALPDTCTIQTGTRASDSQGGNPKTFADTYTDVPCRQTPFSRREVDELIRRGQVMSDRPFWLTLVRNQPVSQDDRVKKDAVTYEVVYIDEFKTYQATKRVQIVRIEAT